MQDLLKIGRFEFQSRFILGSGKYSLELINSAIKEARAEVITLALRRVNANGIENILDFIPKNITLLPNTSGARNAEEALRIARLARELCGAELIKIEVIRDSKYLLPDNYESIKAVELLAKDGFTPLPYMSADLYVARAMCDAGAAAIMPLAAPIGSNKGLCAREFIQILLNEINLPIIVDAGLGTPAQACEAMQMGVAAVMLNTALAEAKNIPLMARAFALAVEAGRAGYLAGFQACEAMQMGVAAVMLNTALAEAKNIPLMARAFALAVEAGRAGYLAGLARENEARASSPLTGFLRD